MKKDNSDNSKRVTYPTQAMVMIRFFAAVYFAYIAISLGDVGSRYTGTEVWIYRIAQILFLVAGVAIGLLSGRDLLQGRYIGGKLDESVQENANEDEAQSEMQTTEDKVEKDEE